MNTNIQILEIVWRGLQVRVGFNPEYSKTFKDLYGYPLGHLEVMVISPERSPLPISETGYKSSFLSPEDVLAEGGPANYVQAWLDHAAQSPTWKEKEEAAKQMVLF